MVSVDDMMVKMISGKAFPFLSTTLPDTVVWAKLKPESKSEKSRKKMLFVKFMFTITFKLEN
jgi:hypothetical protein